MAGERINTMIEKLLDEAQAAANAGNWSLVGLRANAVLRLDPDDQDGQMFAAAAQSGGRPATAKKKKNWVGFIVTMVIVLGLWLGGVFDVFFATQGIPLSAHNCYSNVYGGIWCIGPLSTNPLPDYAYIDENNMVRLK